MLNAPLDDKVFHCHRHRHRHRACTNLQCTNLQQRVRAGERVAKSSGAGPQALQMW